ncbi:MAG: imidazole glycerol phosphate synthase subunit HisH [Bacteroidales bacterium]
MIGIINYGCGNLGSIENMLDYLNIRNIIINKPEDIERADKFILPGVGAFDYGINQLLTSGIKDSLSECVLVKKMPILGICLGMQLLTNSSHEGNSIGLGWIDADTIRFENHADYKIPHMGWNYVHDFKNEGIFEGFQEIPKFYFVHSYYVVCKKSENILCQTSYINKFTSGIINQNIIGIQFHPEKSHKYGMQVFKNFNKL